MHALPVTAMPVLVLKLAKIADMSAKYSPRLMMTATAHTEEYEVEFVAGAYSDQQEDPRDLTVAVDLGEALSAINAGEIRLAAPELKELESTALEQSNLVSPLLCCLAGHWCYVERVCCMNE